MTETLKYYYDDSFFVGQAKDSRASAAVVVPIVNEIVQPCSVLDVGCGVGGGGWRSGRVTACVTSAA